MYPVELESNTSTSYLDLLLSIGRDTKLHTSIHAKLDDFNFQNHTLSVPGFLIFHLRPPIQSLYDMQGLASDMN